MMFVALTQYAGEVIPGSEPVKEHWSYLDEKLDAGELMFSGPQNPRVGGVLILRLPNRDAAERFMINDPLSQAGLITFDLIEFDAIRSAI